jgi:hypothetical protein
MQDCSFTTSSVFLFLNCKVHGLGYMELLLTLEQTSQVWTLRKGDKYTVGSSLDCSISLPYKKLINPKHLEFYYDGDNAGWRVEIPSGEKQTRVNERLVDSALILNKTHIVLGSSITLTALPISSLPSLNSQPAKSRTSSRLISGNAYLLGMRGSLTLLNFLRADPYKAKSPESSLDLEEISTHVAQAISLFLVFSSVAMIALGVQLLVSWISFGFLGGIFFWYQSLLLSNWLALALGAAPYSYDGKLGFFSSLDLIAAFVLAYELAYMRWAIARRFLKKNFRADFKINALHKLINFLKRRTRKIDPTQNVITFGGFRPFLGAGKPINSSDIAVSIRRQPVASSDTADGTIDIPVANFYDAVDEAVKKLKLPNLEILSQLHVKGFELDQDDIILQSQLSQPVSMLPEDEIWFLGQGKLESDSRAYRVYRYIDTKRDSVLSYFVRFNNIGGITFVEAVAYGLTSFDRRYYSLSSTLRDSKFSRWIKTFLLFALLSQFRFYLIPGLWQLAIYLINLFEWWRYDFQQRRAARLHEEYNYGLARTFRESIAAPFDSSYYGNQDLVMYWRAIQQSLFKGITTVLKENNLDTSQFENSVQAIINHGVMVTGGHLNASQLTVGQGVRATFKKVISNSVGLAGEQAQ